jgi:hypothetical protein
MALVDCVLSSLDARSLFSLRQRVFRVQRVTSKLSPIYRALPGGNFADKINLSQSIIIFPYFSIFCSPPAEGLVDFNKGATHFLTPCLRFSGPRLDPNTCENARENVRIE